MSLYDVCAACHGRGSLPCNECDCTACGASGKVDVKCTRCESGKVTCDYCHGSGKTEDHLKSVYFFVKIITRYGPCIICQGKGRTNCETCHGTTNMTGTCPRCGGSGQNATCAKCNSRRSVPCRECKGAGRFESQWVKSLQSWPVDRLRFEIEKRQRKISTLQIQLSRNSQEYDRLQEEWNDEYNSRRAQGRGALNDFDASGFQGGTTHLVNQIQACEGEISQLESEMNAIEQVLNTM